MSITSWIITWRTTCTCAPPYSHCSESACPLLARVLILLGHAKASQLFLLGMGMACTRTFVCLCSAKHGFDPNSPRERRRMALRILSAGFAVEWLRPLPPDVKLVGPLLPQPAAPLPPDLEACDWLSSHRHASCMQGAEAAHTSSAWGHTRAFRAAAGLYEASRAGRSAPCGHWNGCSLG